MKPRPLTRVLYTIYFERPGTYIKIRFTNRIGNLREIYTMPPHRFRVDINLIFSDETTNRCDLAHAFYRLKRKPNRPILNRAKLIRVPTSNRIPVGGLAPQGYTKRFAQGR